MAVSALWSFKRYLDSKSSNETTSNFFILEPLIAGLAACVGLFFWNIPLGAGMPVNQFWGPSAWLGSTLLVGIMEAIG